MKPDEEKPAKSDKLAAKGKENGQDVLSPLIESVATAVVGTVAAVGCGRSCAAELPEPPRFFSRRWRLPERLPPSLSASIGALHGLS